MPIITSTCGYKSPHKRKRRKVAEITIDPKEGRRPVLRRGEAAANGSLERVRPSEAGDLKQSTTRGNAVHHVPANDDC
jgi:hypothetical protein